MEKLTLILDFQSPYTTTRQPRQYLPTGEVLATNGTTWIIGYFNYHLVHGKLRVSADYEELYNVRLFAVLPEKLKQNDQTKLN